MDATGRQHLDASDPLLMVACVCALFDGDGCISIAPLMKCCAELLARVAMVSLPFVVKLRPPCATGVPWTACTSCWTQTVNIKPVLEIGECP